jgi:hypothetical protein
MATSTKASRITIPNPDSMGEWDALPQPYSIDFAVQGTRGYLFNRYDVPANPEPKQKGVKVDRPLESMVTLDSDGHLACRAVQLWNSVVAAGKYRPNPRSTKGSFSVILKEALEIAGTHPRHPDLLTFTAQGKPYDGWDFEYSSRVKNGGAFAGHVTRVRPALEPGWVLEGRATILLPQYVTVPQLHEVFEMAGRFGGIGDGRTGGLGFGRFMVRAFAPSAE